MERNFTQIIENLNRDERRGGIGTLGEKTLHAALKAWYQPNNFYQEIKVGRYVADIVTESGQIMEIQTRSFGAMRKKLDTFLKEYEVVVVHPLAKIKWVRWIDPETGELSQRRRSPKQAKALEICRELYAIKNYLDRPNLHFLIPLLEVEEYKLKNGWSPDGKKGSTRFERIPLDMLEQVELNEKADYRKLLPQGLPEEFTSQDLKKQGKVSIGLARTALNVLTAVEAVERVGKRGNTILYRVTG